MCDENSEDGGGIGACSGGLDFSPAEPEFFLKSARANVSAVVAPLSGICDSSSPYSSLDRMAS